MLPLSQGFQSNANYICDEEDDAIIKSISCCDDGDDRLIVRIDDTIIKSISCCDDGDRLIVRIDDAFVTFDNFKCLLSPSEYLNGDVNTISVKKISLYKSIFLYGDSKQNLLFNCRL